jgi:hypothetical protein
LQAVLQGGAPIRDWLIQNLRVYLNGFWNRGIRPKTRKDSQKVAGRKYDDWAFTNSALTTMRPYAKWMLL